MNIQGVFRDKRKNMSSSSTSSVENSPVKKMASINQEKEVSDTVLHLKSIMDRLDNLFKSSDFTSAVSSVVENVFSPISDKMEFEFAKIHKRLDETENKQLTIEIENSDLRKDNDKLNQEINGLKEQNISLKRDVDTLLEKANEQEQYGRLEAIRIHGIPEVANENCKEKVCNVFQQKLGIDIKPNDITKIHRLDQLYNKPGKPRPIILRFIAHYHKRACIENRRKLKGTGIVITEDLTQINYGTLNRAYKNERIESVWSTEGKLYAKLKHGQRIRIFPFKNIDDTISEALSRSSTRTAEGRDARKE